LEDQKREPKCTRETRKCMQGRSILSFVSVARREAIRNFNTDIIIHVLSME
jgi:hypothetical protein